jgi:hypothetical protein
LGYEVPRPTGLAQEEGWDEILDCFDAERERGVNEKEAQEEVPQNQ